LFTIGDRAFPVAAARIWNGLPPHVTSAPSLPVFSQSSEDTPLQTLLSVTPSSVFVVPVK